MQNNTDSVGSTPTGPTIHNLEKPNESINEMLSVAQVYLVAALTANTFRPATSKEELKDKDRVANGIKSISNMIGTLKQRLGE